MTTDPFLYTPGAATSPYPALLMFAVAHGIRPTPVTRKSVDLNALADTMRATEAALERARTAHARTVEFYEKN